MKLKRAVQEILQINFLFSYLFNILIERVSREQERYEMLVSGVAWRFSRPLV